MNLRGIATSHLRIALRFERAYLAYNIQDKFFQYATQFNKPIRICNMVTRPYGLFFQTRDIYRILSNKPIIASKIVD